MISFSNNTYNSQLVKVDINSGLNTAPQGSKDLDKTRFSRQQENSATQSDKGKTDQSKSDTVDITNASYRDQAGNPLSAEETALLKELQSRDQEVRQHEMAHIAAGGHYVQGGAVYSYKTGPDGKRYAVGGEVGIDTSRENTPEATISKMRVVRRAALAPASPSAQDRAVAARATLISAEAQAELIGLNLDKTA